MRDMIKQRAFQSKWIKDRRRAWIDQNGPCKLCGSIVDLEIDHIETEAIWPFLSESLQRSWFKVYDIQLYKK